MHLLNQFYFSFHSLADSSLLSKIFRKQLNTNTYDLEIQRKDPNNPLFSVKTFEALKL